MNNKDLIIIPEKIDWKPVFFTTDTTSKERRAYILFLLLFIVALVSITWPAYTLVNRADIIIIGLPLNLFWLVLWKATIFTGLIFLYRFEYPGKKNLEKKRHSKILEMLVGVKKFIAQSFKTALDEYDSSLHNEHKGREN